MVGCIVITLKEKPRVSYIGSNPHGFASLSLQSTMHTSLMLFILKLRVVISILFSRAYIIYISNKLFSKKSFCVVLCSIIISNIVRYLFINYGIDSPLIHHPVLLSSAAALSSFLSISSKLTIELLFSIFGDKEIAMVLGDTDTISMSKSSTTFKMVNGNKDQIASNLDNKSEDFSFDKMDSLLKKLQTQIEEVNSIRKDHTITELKDLNDKLNKWEQFCTRDLTKKLSSLAQYNFLFTTDEIVQLMVYIDRLGKPAGISSSCINVKQYIDIQTNLASNSRDQYTSF